MNAAISAGLAAGWAAAGLVAPLPWHAAASPDVPVALDGRSVPLRAREARTPSCRFGRDSRRPRPYHRHGIIVFYHRFRPICRPCCRHNCGPCGGPCCRRRCPSCRCRHLSCHRRSVSCRRSPAFCPSVASSVASPGSAAVAIYVQETHTSRGELYASSSPTPTAYAACIFRWTVSHGRPQTVHVGAGFDGAATLRSLQRRVRRGVCARRRAAAGAAAASGRRHGPDGARRSIGATRSPARQARQGQAARSDCAPALLTRFPLSDAKSV